MIFAAKKREINKEIKPTNWSHKYYGSELTREIDGDALRSSQRLNFAGVSNVRSECSSRLNCRFKATIFSRICVDCFDGGHTLSAAKQTTDIPNTRLRTIDCISCNLSFIVCVCVHFSTDFSLCWIGMFVCSIVYASFRC